MTDPLAALTALICEHSGLTGVRADRLARRIVAEWLPAQGVVDPDALAEALWADQNDDPDLLWENVYNDEYHRRARNLIAEMGWQDAADVRRQTAEDIAAAIEARRPRCVGSFGPEWTYGTSEAYRLAALLAREVGGDRG